MARPFSCAVVFLLEVTVFKLGFKIRSVSCWICGETNGKVYPIYLREFPTQRPISWKANWWSLEASESDKKFLTHRWKRFYFPTIFYNFSSCAPQILDLASMKWRLAPISYPFGVWGHCVAMTSKGDLYSTGGWSDSDPQASLKSNWVLLSGTVTPGFENGQQQGWTGRNSMNVGRGTHACHATYYKVWTFA